MLFSTPIFIFGFLPLVLYVYYAILKINRTLQNIFLTICSLFFYAWGEPIFVFIMIGSTLLTWLFSLLIFKENNNHKFKKILLIISISINILLIFIYKYLVFTIINLNFAFEFDIFVPDIVLPIGISFFTFQAMSYIIDIYRNKCEPIKNPLDVILYISFFPQLIAGPIISYNTIAHQIKERKESLNDFTEGTYRFLVGLSKKMFIANSLAPVADYAFSALNRSVSLAWLGALAYTFQIYYDFSGYSDMAIGLSKMFGFHFPENFNYPYISKSISEFWRRWHISLGTWFRDYVYIPLGGSRVESKFKIVFNLFIVWFLTGVWHGANWTFIIWGLLYFILITIEKTTSIVNKLGYFANIYTMFFVLIGWVIFRSPDIVTAIAYIQSMFGFGSDVLFDVQTLFHLKENWIVFLFAIIFSAPIFNMIPYKVRQYKVSKIIATIISILLVLITISYTIKSNYNPFIYFNF